jgi:hypothetical protein
MELQRTQTIKVFLKNKLGKPNLPQTNSKSSGNRIVCSFDEGICEYCMKNQIQ